MTKIKLDPNRVQVVLNKLRLPIFFFLALYFASCVIRAWHNPSGAHGHRQIFTSGVTVSFANEIRAHGAKGAIDGFLFPRVIERSLTSGINITEFPLLNALTVPFYLISTRAGVLLGTLLIFAFGVFASFFAVPKLSQAWGVPLPRWAGPLIYFALPSVGFHSSIYMPEGLSFPLLVIGAALLCDPSPRRYWSSWLGALFCLAFAWAVKPLSAVGLLPLVLWPLLHAPKAKSKFLVTYYSVLLLSLSLCVWWYKIHSNEIIWVADGVREFGKGQVSIYSKNILEWTRLLPFQRLSEIGITGFFGLLLRQLSNDQFPIYCGILWSALALYFEPLLFFSLIVMLAGAMSLLGSAIWIHGYYFFATSLMSLILVPRLLSKVKPFGLRIFFVITLIWGVLYNARTNVWISSRTTDYWRLSASLLPSLPEDAHIITDDLFMCPTKLLVTGRPGTLAPNDLSTICKNPGYKSLKLAYLIDESNWIKEKQKVSSCLKDAKLLGSSKERDETWVLVVVEPS